MSGTDTAYSVCYLFGIFLAWVNWAYWVYLVTEWNRLQNIPVLRNRRPQLVKIWVFAFNGWLCIAFFIGSMGTFFDIPFSRNVHVNMATAFFLFFAGLILMLRIWFIYYDWKFAMHLLDQKCFGKIFEYTPWTMRYRKTLGNVKFLSIVGLVFFCTVHILTQLAVYVNPSRQRQFGLMQSVIVFVVAIIPMGYPLAKIQSCRDVINIRREIRANVIIIATFFFIIMAARALTGGNLRLETLILLYTAVITSAINFVFSVQLPVNDAKMDKQAIFLHRMAASKSNLDSTYIDVSKSGGSATGVIELSNNYSTQESHKAMTLSPSSASPAADSKLKEIKLKHVLRDKNGFRLFASHLTKEFSVENLFFVWNYMGLKQDMVDCHAISREEKGMTIPVAREMMKIRNKKTTLQDTHSTSELDASNFVKEFETLYEEYVNPTSNLAINISGPVFRRCRAFMESLDTMDTDQNDLLSELITIFDSMAKEVYVLMERDSFQRFMDTEEFIHYQNEKL